MSDAEASRFPLGPLDLLLLAIAYRGLVVVQLGPSMPKDFEKWFFVASESSSPPAVSLALAGWVLWRRRAELRALPAVASSGARIAGAAACAAGVAVAAWATFTSAHDLLVPSLFLEVLGICAWLRGSAGVRACGLALALLLVALPIPPPLLNSLVYAMQLGTAQFAGWLLYAMGLPAVISSDQILRAEASFAVIENCSGLRSMETLLTLSLLMAELFGRRGLHTALLALAAPAVAFLANGLRVLTLILSGPYSQIQSIHNAQGVAVLLVGLVTLYALDGLLDRWLGQRPPQPAPSGPPAGPRRAVAAGRSRFPTGVLAATCAATLALPAWRAPARSESGLHYQIPAELGEWRSVELKQDEMFLGSVSFQQSFLRRYTAGSQQVDLFAGLGNHDHSVRGPFSPKMAVPGSGWVTEREFEVPLGTEGRVAEGRICRLRTDRRLVYYWIEGASSLGAEAWRAGLALDQSPWRRRRDAVVLRISTPLAGAKPEDVQRAESVLHSFLGQLEPQLERMDEHYARKRFSSFLPAGKSLSLLGLSG